MPEPMQLPAKRSASRYLLFRVERQLYALPTAEISEVIPMPRIAAVPQSPPSLLGLANLRGAVIPVVSARALLGRQTPESVHLGRAIVLDGAQPVAVAVDQVETFATVGKDEVEVAQAELAAAPGEKLRGAFRLRGGQSAAKILDIRLLLSDAFQGRSTNGPGNAGTGRKNIVSAAGSNAGERILVSFDVGHQEYALDLAAVSEIVTFPDTVAQVPLADSVVLGVTAFRETLLPLLSLGRLLGFAQEEAGAGRRKVIVSAVKGRPIGLVADGIRQILRAAADLIEPTPALLAARAGGETRVAAIYRAEGGRRLVSILSPESLFRDELMQKIGTATMSKTSAVGDSGPHAAGEETAFVVFRLGDEEFCLPAAGVEEVAALPEAVARLPKTPKFLEGVVNLRGEIIPVIDQRKRFDLPKFSGEQRLQRVIVVRSGKHRAGLIVDSIARLLRFPASAIEPAPDLADDGSHMIRGVINLPDQARIIMVLDPDELLSGTERSLLDNFAARSKGAV